MHLKWIISNLFSRLTRYLVPLQITRWKWCQLQLSLFLASAQSNFGDNESRFFCLPPTNNFQQISYWNKFGLFLHKIKDVSDKSYSNGHYIKFCWKHKDSSKYIGLKIVNRFISNNSNKEQGSLGTWNRVERDFQIFWPLLSWTAWVTIKQNLHLNIQYWLWTFIR